MARTLITGKRNSALPFPLFCSFLAHYVQMTELWRGNVFFHDMISP